MHEFQTFILKQTSFLIPFSTSFLFKLIYWPNSSRRENINKTSKSWLRFKMDVFTGGACMVKCVFWVTVGDDSGNWASPTHMGNLGWVLNFGLAQPYLSCCMHLASEPLDGKRSLSLFLPSKTNKWNSLKILFWSVSGLAL